MRKIKLPDDNTLNKIKTEYQKLILNKFSQSNLQRINEKLEKENIPYSFKELLTISFEKLFIYKDYKIDDKNTIDYIDFQPNISKFYSKYSALFGLESCCYCNINYVNPYLLFENDSSNFFHFLKRAQYKELIKIKNIGPVRANIIIEKYAKQINNYSDINEISEVPIRLALMNVTNENGDFDFDYIDSKNEFTLDHILPKNKYPLLSLCLFNIIPSCYSCNSKLKKAIEISDSIEDYKVLSPTSSSERKIGSFKLYFTNDELDENLHNTIDGYSIKLESVYQKYINLFQLQGRYNFHKEKSFKLIKKRKIYTSSMIDSIEKLFFDSGIARTQEDIKRDIFGDLIFDKQSTEPFSSYLKDLASELKII